MKQVLKAQGPHPERREIDARSQSVDKGFDFCSVKLRQRVKQPDERTSVLRSVAVAVSDRIWIEKVELHMRAASSRPAAGDEFEAILAAAAVDAEVQTELAKDLATFLNKAPADLDAELSVLADARAGDLSLVLDDARLALMARLGLEGAA